MRIIPAALQSHLDTGTTTLCYCWKMTLRSGATLGFTDHDEAVSFDGVNFEAQAGFTSTEIHSALDMAVDNLEASGALRSGQLDDTRLNAGDFDHAAIEIWRVNWQDVTQRILQRKGHLGEVSYGQGHFKAEMRGLAHLFNQPKGRLFQFGCDAALGDVRCKVNLDTASYKGQGTISAVRENSIDVAGLNAFSDDWFTGGVANWSDGHSLTIKRHRAFSNSTRIDFWQNPKFTVAIAQQIILIAGCNKQFTTCKAKFGNQINFRGFPHMPGTDFVMSVASKTDSNNGASRNI